MPLGKSPPTESVATSPDTIWPYIGVGCFTLPIGFFGGGMIAMLAGKIMDAVTGCVPPKGLPVCSWWVYWWIGAGIGVIGLPTFAVLRLRRGRKRLDAGLNG